MLVLGILAEIRIPLFGGSITIRNNSNGSYTVETEKKSPTKAEKYASFTLRNGTVENFEFLTNSTSPESNEPTTEAPEKKESMRKRPSQQRPKSDVLNALLSMFGRF
ncbi:hypothetical protein GCK72_006583 [Caenorhabditis remanei]|uniref:Uncharacterized protein n=1 Tax=Caenorhabditis remanei TaxID=31234 RepID=A0A6A5HGN4_CAERE|nr:hypothetical protein GCK72_006583 [Caenorhabditis remanei]KAF1766625.1 hypothetical protein GCK72_006583 [Caenorhabditis remanei]